MENQTEDYLDEYDALEIEKIKKIQQTILDRQNEIEQKRDEFRAIGYDYEVRNLEYALENAQQPENLLDYWQILNLEWCCEIMRFPKPLLD